MNTRLFLFTMVLAVWSSACTAAQFPKNPPLPTAKYCNKKAAEIIAGEKMQAKIIENFNTPDNKPKTIEALGQVVMMLHGFQSTQVGDVVLWYMLVGCDNKYLLNAYWDYKREQINKLQAPINKN